MSPEVREIFDRRMRPTTMHTLLAVEWLNVEDAVEACLADLEAGHISLDGIKEFMQSRFRHLEGLQKAWVTANSTMRARTCYQDLLRERELA